MAVMIAATALPTLAQPIRGDYAPPKGVASASGRYMFLANAQPVMFIYSAWKEEDGSVHGSYWYWQSSINVIAWGDVTCLNVRDNRAWFAGNVHGIRGNQDFAWLVGSESWWQVFDNSYYGLPDVSTGLGAAAAPAGEDWCNDMPEARFPWDLMNGNLVVRDNQ